MNTIKQLYLKNSIMQFLFSYILVLIIPVVIIFQGFNSAFETIETNIIRSNVSMLEQSMYMIDVQITVMERMALQTSQNSAIQNFAKLKNKKSGYVDIAFGARDQFYDIMRYQSLEIIKNPYIYFKNSNLVLYESTFYTFDIFTTYLQAWGMSLSGWEDLFNGKKDENNAPFYINNTMQNLHYIMPLTDTFTGNKLGMIAYQLNANELDQLLDFTGRYENYSVFILNEQNQVLWSKDGLDCQEWVQQNNKKWINSVESNFLSNQGSQSMVYYQSAKTNWTCILVAPERDTLQQLMSTRILVFILLGVAIVVGFMVSFILSFQKGKAIDEIFRIIPIEGPQSRGIKQLSQLVQGILHNHSELLQELEKDKPILQKAFLHDLVKAEFHNRAEMEYVAKNAGISIDIYLARVVAFQPCLVNDFYDVNEAIMDEVRIISQLIVNYLMENYKDQIWFYKKNYLTTLAIFITNDSADCYEIIEKTYIWLKSEYYVESRWGISRDCSDLLLLWKSCEEALTAIDYQAEDGAIHEYFTDFHSNSTYYFSETAEEKLISNIENGDMNGTEIILDIIIKENFVHRKMDRNIFVKFNRHIINLMSRLHIDKEDINQDILDLNEVVLNETIDFNEYTKRWKKLCLGICQKMNAKKFQQKKQLVENMMLYIQHNFTDASLCLAKISIEFKISEGYISALFKEYAGINFTDYVESLRIELAGKLLKNPENNISNISLMVGYNSVQSFRRAFKRVRGISPKNARFS